jgi:hypothetical protein
LRQRERAGEEGCRGAAPAIAHGMFLDPSSLASEAIPRVWRRIPFPIPPLTWHGSMIIREGYTIQIFVSSIAPPPPFRRAKNGLYLPGSVEFDEPNLPVPQRRIEIFRIQRDDALPAPGSSIDRHRRHDAAATIPRDREADEDEKGERRRAADPRSLAPMTYGGGGGRGRRCFHCCLGGWYRLVWATLKTDASSAILDL